MRAGSAQAKQSTTNPLNELQPKLCKNTQPATNTCKLGSTKAGKKNNQQAVNTHHAGLQHHQHGHGEEHGELAAELDVGEAVPVCARAHAARRERETRGVQGSDASERTATIEWKQRGAGVGVDTPSTLTLAAAQSDTQTQQEVLFQAAANERMRKRQTVKGALGTPRTGRHQGYDTR